MIEGLARIIEDVAFNLSLLTLVFLRIGAAMALLPAFGEMLVPVRVKLALTIGLTLIVAPAVSPIVQETTKTGPELLAAGGAEVLAGLVLGIALRLVIFALQIAGTIAAQSTSLSQLFGGGAIDPQPALGVVLVIGGLALATLFGLHVKVAAMLILSYDLLPPGRLLPPDPLAEWALAAVSQTFRTAVILAVPFLLASLLYNLALGVINRAMPQLMVAFVGAPAITLGSLILLALTAPLLLSIWVELLDSRLADPLGVRDGR